LEPKKKTVARQGLGEHVPAATDAYITIGGDLHDSQIGKTVKYGHESRGTHETGRTVLAKTRSNLPDHTAIHFSRELHVSIGSSWLVVRNLHCWQPLHSND
jgi:hypothetical protein